MNTTKLLAASLSVMLVPCLVPSPSLAFSRPTHEWQLREVFSEVEGQAFHDAVREISWSIDNGLLLSFKATIGRVPGNHRISATVGPSTAAFPSRYWTGWNKSTRAGRRTS